MYPCLYKACNRQAVKFVMNSLLFEIKSDKSWNMKFNTFRPAYNVTFQTSGNKEYVVIREIALIDGEWRGCFTLWHILIEFQMRFLIYFVCSKISESVSKYSGHVAFIKVLFWKVFHVDFPRIIMTEVFFFFYSSAAKKYQ